MVVCGKPAFADDQKDTLLNPVIMIEVLSKSTEAYDRGFKFAEYRKLESLQEYLLVSQTEARIEKFRRRSDEWVLSEYVGLDQSASFESLSCTVSMVEIYANVTFSPEENPHAGA